MHESCIGTLPVAAKNKVLVVEDDADLRRLYAIGLNQQGFEVKLAANGAEALDRLLTEKPQVILLDMLMPIMDGWEVLEKISSMKLSGPIPVVVISGQAHPTDRPLHPLIVGWLSKPVALADLSEAVREALLQSRRKRRSTTTV